MAQDSTQLSFPEKFFAHPIIGPLIRLGFLKDLVHHVQDNYEVKIGLTN